MSGWEARPVTPDAAATSPLDLGAGWLPRPRALDRWPVYQALSAHGRRVVEVLLLLARYRPGEVWVGGQRVAVGVGEVFASEEEVARLCGRGVSRKVVRTTIARLEAGRFLGRRAALPAGQCPHIITIRDYPGLVFQAAPEGPPQGPPEGHERASTGPTLGPTTGPYRRSPTPKPENTPSAAGSPRVEVEDNAPSSAPPRWPLLGPWREALAQRMAVPPDWFRIAKPDRVEAVRDQLQAEIARLGVERAAEIAAEAATHSSPKPRWLAWFVGCLQDAREPHAAAAPPPAPPEARWAALRGRLEPDALRAAEAELARSVRAAETEEQVDAALEAVVQRWGDPAQAGAA